VSSSNNRPVLEVRDLAVGPVRGIDFTVHEGEIVGLAGLVGSGRSSVLKTIFGALDPRGGAMGLRGKRYAPTTIRSAMDAGVAFVPEDRAHEAGFPDRTVSENIAIAKFKEYFRGFMPRRRETRAAEGLIRTFGVKVAGPDAQFSSMSGGNQQKVILARWLQRDPELVLLDEPTQGVDVMSRADIYGAIRTAAGSGCATLVASSDLIELHALCDRILVLSGGKILHEVAAAQVSVDELTSLVMREQTA
jgi:ribose transport system ATP-binding protein